MPLNKHTILITGAGGGLGSTAALTLAKQGASLILLDKSIPKLEKIYDAIVNSGAPTPVMYPFDLAGATEVQYHEMADAIAEKFGQLEGLLHSACEFSSFAPMSLQSTKDWGHILNVNLNAPFLLTQVLLPLLKKSAQASIVFTSDSFARKPRAYLGAYGVAISALETYAKVLADELETSPIRINILIPGPVDSPLRKKSFPAEDKNKLPSMAAIAPVYLYLFSHKSIGITGQFIDARTFNL